MNLQWQKPMKMLKESMPKNLLLIEKVRKESVPRNQKNSKEMNACLKNSNLWAHLKILKLTTNMRVRLQNDDSGQTFSDQLLAIGN